MYFLTVVLVLIANLAQATTYYVSTSGSNSNDGLTLTTPKRNINVCAALLTAGDTCYVRGGTYTNEGTIRIGVTGTATAPIKLLNYQNERPIISYSSQVSSNRIIIEPTTTQPPTALGYITVEGFEISGGWEGIKFVNMHNSVIRRNTIHDGFASGILGVGGHHNLFEKNIIYHQGDFAGCAAGTALCNQQHGMYMHGDSYTVINNVIYDNIGIGIQHNGSSTSLYTTTRHPGPEFAGGKNWVIANNTVAYEANAAGITIWGDGTNARIENNALYENRVTGTSAQAIFFTGNGGTGVTIRNNHSYASGSGGTAFIGTNGGATEGVNYTQSGNVVNVSAPAFVNGGSNSLPASPDFRLTASAPVNICRSNEFLNNSTCVVGAFKTIADPTASIHANIVTLTFPMSTATPIQIPSAAGVSIACTGANCPGSPTVSTATRKTGTDTQVEVVISGITSDSCVATNQAWTISYDSTTGGWTGFDDIGAYAGSNQQVFSFTNLAVTNLCDGTGPPAGVGTPLIVYALDEGTGTTATNTGSSGAADNGTLSSGATWVSGKTGSGVLIGSGTTQKIDVPYGSGVDPSSQSLTIVVPVNVPSGSESGLLFVAGPSLGTNQRAYICGYQGTWRISMQSTSCQSTSTSNLTVVAGWNFLVLVLNSTTDVATLSNNGIAGTGGATTSYTSFTFASDWIIGRIPENNGFGGTYDDFALYTSVEDQAALYAAWNAPTVAVGTFGMPSYRFQAVYLPELGGSPTNLTTAINTAKDVVQGGAVALLAEIYCENVADCEQDGFRWEARHTNTLPFTASDSWIQIPGMETDTHIWMWGADTNTLLNSGPTTSRLSAGSCAVTNGVTMLTSAQVPAINLPQDGCVVLRGIFRLGTTASGYYDIRLSQQNGTAFTGTVNPARINVIAPQANAGP